MMMTWVEVHLTDKVATRVELFRIQRVQTLSKSAHLAGFGKKKGEKTETV